MSSKKKDIFPSTTTITPLTFKVAKLWGSPEGTTQKITVDAKVQFDPKEIDAATHLKGSLLLIKLKDEISAIISDSTIGVRVTCQRCLKTFVEKISIPGAEREFLPHPPRPADDQNEFFLIDMNAMSIDLTEMMRQEIILHFPLISVCSKSCRGLCQYCGKDRNKKLCKCKPAEEPGTQKPFKNLKKLLQNS